ncbi:saccharopine dehydrogenase [Luminiphilus syltensis NOR5-1B]|uniref:Saccharopine dehydrogenase n=1 Tax=Luminiphilus syltensis NOR5-1B TaxID=565045 RepID=B8KSZ9_9GAMM|nr:saccharopine dehydrogenase NADP-binding domain-containing protein [Luminiphilus syltensis]EED36321.1 saccharopine dehydrogenase [Luminiphilus syltensis NOR5-1B]
MAANQQRKFDIVLFGATGFTGGLVAEYLSHQDETVSWAIAGRSKEKLETVRNALGLKDLPLIVADSGDPSAMRELADSTRVICTTVGPYALYGSELVKACAEMGTHYCDLCGEVPWMAQLFAPLNAAAQQSGARIVHCCGFDSIPSDLSVMVAQQTMYERHGVHARAIRGRMGRSKGTASGGTVASMMNVMDQAKTDTSARKAVRDPYSLYPPGAKPGPDRSDQMTPRWDDKFDSWTGPFVMAMINARIVRRSNALAGFPYGEDFQYDEAQLCKTRGRAVILASALGAFFAAASFKPARGLLERFLPAPGEGPGPKARETGFFEFFAHAQHPEDPEKDVRIKVFGKRDPGYGATSRMLAQAALCLANDESPVGGGVWTPATALGNNFVRRLAGVNVTFEAVDLA